jgi:hypothetical protein
MLAEMNKQKDQPSRFIQVATTCPINSGPYRVEGRAGRVRAEGIDSSITDEVRELDPADTIDHLLNKHRTPYFISCTGQWPYFIVIGDKLRIQPSGSINVCRPYHG